MAVAAAVVVVVADMPSAKSNTAQPGGGRIEVASRSAPAPELFAGMRFADWECACKSEGATSDDVSEFS